MKLIDLEAVFVGDAHPGEFMEGVPFSQAQGLLFTCPKCMDHNILAWFDERGVPVEMTPAPRWIMEGTGIEDLTLRPSVQVGAPCGFHAYITRGEVEDL